MENKQIIMVGDVHGSWSVIANFIESYSITDTLFIQVGDFGVGFRKRESDMNLLEMLNGLLVENRCELYVIRGNHDDPNWFRGDELPYSNIRLLPDYTVMELNGERWLFVGGAVSVDRMDCVQNGMKWFPDEKFVLDEEKLTTVGRIDRVVTHSAPDMTPPFTKGGFVESKMRKDPDLCSDIETERSELTRMYNILKESGGSVTHWYYGHFHRTHVYNTNVCGFRCLDVNEFLLVS
jgi:DNA repair exonuclease SbcCD nuclease subunit